MMINKGSNQTSKGKEKFNHLSAFNPIKIPTAMLTKNCAPMPAYRISSRFVSFLVFKLLFLDQKSNVVKNNTAKVYIGILD